MAEAVRAGAEVYGALRRELSGRKLSTGLGDEGGFAPEITEPEEVLRLLVQAISDAGYKTGADGMSIALDLAASEFRQSDGRYRVAGDLLTSVDMIDRLAAYHRAVPVHLIEDGLGEGGEDGWIAPPPAGRHDRAGRRRHLLLNSAIVTRAIARGIGDATLIKLDQIGTVTDAAGYGDLPPGGRRRFVSHRSSETRTISSPTWLSAPARPPQDRAPARGERVASTTASSRSPRRTHLRYGMPVG